MPKFIIGIGSQRAGSTLLHKILDECTEIFMHPVKELHYYDTLFSVRHSSVLKDFSKRQVEHILDRFIQSSNFDFVDKQYKCYIRTNKILAKKSVEEIDYIDLYRPGLMGNNFLGEITPEYMILPEEGIQKMRDNLGGETKIILIGRNPVDRFISAFKLLKMYNEKDYDMAHFQIDLEDTIQNMPSWMEQQYELNDYEQAIVKYKKYFDDVLFFPYEKLITDPEMIHNKMEKFLEMTIDKDKYHKILSKKVNAIGATGTISDEIIEDLEKRFTKLTEWYFKNI